MCAIFGSTDYGEFLELYKLGKARGIFSFGGIFRSVSKTAPDFCARLPGEYQYNSEHVNFAYYLGHTRAPTGDIDEFSSKSSHPFIAGRWAVAHNGILTNFDELKSGIPPTLYGNIDSSIIPALLQVESGNFNNSRDTILHVLRKLKGIFSVWVYNSITSEIFLAKSGSTLFIDRNAGTFSSINPGNLEEVKDGTLLQLTPEGIATVGMFDTASPFFIL